jgi:hypothetical protein
MADSVSSEVRSNIDRLDAEVFHRCLVELIEDLAKDGGRFLKAIVPVGETAALQRHAGHTAAHDDGVVITAAVGVKAIEGAARRFFQVGTKDTPVPGEQHPGDYPIFVDRGTGEFGPTGQSIFARRANFMAFPGAEGHTIFRHKVAGQRGQHFMLKTYVEMLTLLPALSKVYAAKVSAETRPVPM